MPYTHETYRSYAPTYWVAVEVPESAPNAGDNLFLSYEVPWNTGLDEAGNHAAIQALVDDLTARMPGFPVSATADWTSRTSYTPTP